MSDVFDVLATDHAEIKEMLSALQQSPDRLQGASQTVLKARSQVAERLVMESSRHESAEERYFWPAVRQHVLNGNTLADHAISQDTKAKEVLSKLDKLDSSDAEFDRLIAQLIPVAREHIEFQESAVWPELRGALSADQAHELGEQVRKAKELGPTRPHPHISSDPNVQKTAGSVVGLIDQLRDAVSGRGGDTLGK
jgi:hemerythrin-like domain-containing protein